MGINDLVTNVQKAEFSTMYIPKGISWKVVGVDENLFVEEYKLGPKDYPIHTSLFKEVGIRLPLWPLLVDFLRCTHLTLG